MKYRSYKDAQRRGGKDVWPGCGELGRCMPCNGIHNFDYISGDRWIDNYRCSQNHRTGCPQPKPEPKHDFNRQGRCSRCGARDPRPRLSPAQLELVRRAANDQQGDGVRARGAVVSTARALERRGLGELAERDSAGAWSSRFRLTDKGREAARLLGLVRQPGEASDERDPYAEGVEAAHSSKSDTANPYPVPGDDHLSWNDGYFSVAGPDEP